MKQLIKLYLYHMTADDICKANSQNRDYRFYKKELPEFCLNSNGFENIMIAEDHYQLYTDSISLPEDYQNELFILFDMHPISSFIAEEHGQAGWDLLLEEDENTKDLFNLIKNLPEQYFNKWNAGYIPVEFFLVVDLQFEEEDSYLTITGYLDFDLKEINLKNVIGG